LTRFFLRAGAARLAFDFFAFDFFLRFFAILVLPIGSIKLTNFYDAVATPAAPASPSLHRVRDRP
jgi:hypothetical protein